MMMMHAYAFIERLCLRQEVCSQCHQVLEVVKDCIIMNECGHMMHESCFRTLQDKKQYSCRSCKAKISMAFVLNSIQVVQIQSNGQNSIRKRKPEFEQKITDYFFSQLARVGELQQQIIQKDSQINQLRDRIQILETNHHHQQVQESQQNEQNWQIGGGYMPSNSQLFSFRNNSNDFIDQQQQETQNEQEEEQCHEEDIEEISTNMVFNNNAKIDINKMKKKKQNPFHRNLYEDQQSPQSSSQTTQEGHNFLCETQIDMRNNLSRNDNYDQHKSHSNSSTQSTSYSNNKLFASHQNHVNTVKANDKLQFYTDLAGLSPQQNILAKLSNIDTQNSIQNNNNNNNNKSNTNTQNKGQLTQDSPTLFSKVNKGELPQNINLTDSQSVNNNWVKNKQINAKVDYYKFSFGNTKQSSQKQSPQKERDTILSLEDTTIHNLEDMKTIIYSQEQVNLIKSFDPYTQSNPSDTYQNKEEEDNIFSFAKARQSEQNVSTSRDKGGSQTKQNNNLLKRRIGQSSSDQKSNEQNRRQSSQEQRHHPSSYNYESPQKQQQQQQQTILKQQHNSHIEDENHKNAVNTALLNSSKSNKSNDSRIKDKCSSCSKDRHSNPNSDSKLESSADRRKRYTAESKISLLAQSKQKLNFFNLTSVSNTNNNNNNNNNINNNNNNNRSLSAKKEIEQIIINNVIDNNSQQQNSQGSSQPQSGQKITLNKKARRPHPDQNLLNQQNVCLKMPKYLSKS